MTRPDHVLIDLGEGRGEVPDADRAARPSRLPRWRWPVPAWLGRRRVGALAGVLVLALAAGGAGQWPESPLRLVARVPVDDGASVMVDAGRLMVLGNGQALAAYSLRDGGRLWQASLGMPVAYGSMSVSDGVILVGAQVTAGLRVLSAAVDEATGRVLWHSPAAIFVALPGTGTVLLQPLGEARIDLVDVRTGAPRWSGPIDECQFTFDVPQVPPTPHAFALLCAGADRVEIVDLPAGTEREVALAPIVPARPGGDGAAERIAPGIATVDRVLVVERPSGGTTAVIEAFRWSDGYRVWSRPGFGPNDLVSACPGGLCVFGPGAGVVLDPATGAVLPLPVPPDPRIYPSAVDFVPLPSNAQPLLTDALLLVPAGRKVPQLPPSTVPLAVGQAMGSDVLRPSPLAEAVHSGTPVGADVRPVDPGTDVVSTGSVLVEVLQADGTVRPLRWLSGIAPSICVARLTYLICPTRGGSASVWQFPDTS